MNKDEYLSAVQNVIYLSSCAVKGTLPDFDTVQKMNLQHLYHAAKKHSMTAVTAFALESVGITDKSFIQDKAKSVRKTAAMDIDWQLLSDELEHHKIWYCPLKGMIIKDFYPSYGMREMSDFDILFDKQFADTVKEIMLSLGFHVSTFATGKDDVYHKPPVSNFEMHRDLFSLARSPEIYHYYSNVKSRLLKDDGKSFAFHFRKEDFYIYVTAHEYKHFAGGGTGLRSLLDTYILVKNADLDFQYIARETRKMGIADFELDNRTLALALFDNLPLSQQQQEMLHYILFSGTYGTVANAVRNNVNTISGKHSKRHYIFHRLFMPLDTVKEAYPFFYKHKILLPFLFFYRIARACTVGRKKTRSELKTLKKM